MVGRVLVVDDEVELKNALVDALVARSYEARGYTSGPDALEALRTEDFDLLISDLMMPEMDGIALIKAALEIDPHLVAIIMTGQGTIQTAVDAMKAGTFDYVLKPFRMQTLMPILTRAINTRRLRKENLQLRETVAIYELAQTIAFTLDPQTLISKLADAALQQTDADEVSVLLPAADGGDLYVAAVRGENRQRLLGERVPREQSISGWVARERQPLLLDGEVNDERFRPLWPHPEIRSAVSVPMQVANKLVGVINLNVLERPRSFNLGQMKALTILASTAAAALEGASLYTKVRQAEEKYRSIFENAIEGLFQSTAEGRFLTVNPAFAFILGYESPEEMIADITDIAHQLYVDPADRVEAGLLQEERGFLQAFEFEAYRRDGERIWLSENRRSVWNKESEDSYFEGSVENITERRQAEQERAQLTAEIENQRQRINNIVSSVPGVVWEAWGKPDVATQRIDFVSDYVEMMLGYSVEEWVATPNFWLTIVHPDDKERTARIAARAFESGESCRLEFRWLTKDGRSVWVESNFVVIADAAGLPVGLRGVNTEITERKQAEQSLRESEERYRDLVENAHDIIYSQDLDGRYTSMNRAGTQITGYSRQEVLTLDLERTVAPEFIGKVREMLGKKLAGEKVTAYEMDLIAKDGHRITVEANTKLVFHDGVPVGVQGIARDVTERKLLEAQLRQAQKMEAIGRLAGGVAHDFNNLLTAINGYSGLALQRIDSDHPLKGYLEEIHKAGDRAANLTRQLLAFGRKQILQPLAISLNDIVTDMNKMLRLLIGGDIELVSKLDPALEKIKADPGQIEQVLVNLVVNARDAMPRGGKLTIETARAELDQDYADAHVGVIAGVYVMLAISDTGTGMDETTQAHMFDPFFTTKESGKGTGLGLSTVYGIVKQSGGNIRVNSELGHGTSFKVYLPELTMAAAEPKRAAGETSLAAGSETILLVEDEDVVRGLARKILERAGYNVLEASRGAEAFRLCLERTEPIDLLLTDVVMPETSGKEVADRLTERYPGLKVLFMSGYTDETIVHQGVLDPNIEFIQKPFTPFTLARKVRDVLDAELVLSDAVALLPPVKGLEKRG